VCEAAAAAGLLDVAYATLDSPLGKLLLATTPRGLIRLAYLSSADESEVLEQLAASVSPRVLAAAWRLDEPRRELEQYFAGRRRRFDIPLDWQLTRGFSRRVLEAATRIPYGATATYKQVAGEAGNPKAFRAAGNALGSNPIPIVVPCHRILHSGGGLGGYTGGVEKKRLLLAVEGGQAPLAEA
jgi:methylated-DNA-[protein]-cysteine S-methyltransferase